MFSVVIPSYNSATWLPSTVECLAVAARRLGQLVEVLIVDDGSTDSTTEVLQHLDAGPWLDIKALRQNNQGRFFARWNGASAASNEQLIFLDSRTLIDENALIDLQTLLDGDSSISSVNALVRTDSKTPLVGQFWEVPVRLGWGSYIRKPITTRIDSENFDRLPKGTTMLFVQKSVFQRVCEQNWPVRGAVHVSDDTALLRAVAEDYHFVLSPSFSGIYRPRSQTKQFFPHAYARGAMFVDGYLGRSRLGTALVLTFVVAPAAVALTVVLIGLAFAWAAALLLALCVILLLIAIPSVIALRNKASIRAVWAFAIFVLPFVAVFWVGLLRGIFQRAMTPATGGAR